MSKICEVCGKAPSAGRNVSHSHRVTNRWFRPNIQRVTIKDKRVTSARPTSAGCRRPARSSAHSTSAGR
ncbi:MAG: 50S ribosomal protein L28 [Eggerthella lenta]